MVIEIPRDPAFKGGPPREGAGKRDGARNPLDDNFGTVPDVEPAAPVEPPEPDQYDLDNEIP